MVSIVLESVRCADDIARFHAQRVKLFATLRRSSMRKGGASATRWLGTTLELDDGTLLWVTYGAPPEGWSPFVDQRVVVECIVWNGPSPELLQAHAGPHVSECSLPIANRD